MNELEVEAKIQDLGLTAPRVTIDEVDAEIVDEQYVVFPGTTFTVCLLTLRNGFQVCGESACASPANFNAEIGRSIARRNARDKIWPLLGFRLRDQIQSERDLER